MGNSACCTSIEGDISSEIMEQQLKRLRQQRRCELELHHGNELVER